MSLGEISALPSSDSKRGSSSFLKLKCYGSLAAIGTGIENLDLGPKPSLKVVESSPAHVIAHKEHRSQSSSLTLVIAEENHRSQPSSPTDASSAAAIQVPNNSCTNTCTTKAQYTGVNAASREPTPQEDPTPCNSSAPENFDPTVPAPKPSAFTVMQKAAGRSSQLKTATKKKLSCSLKHPTQTSASKKSKSVPSMEKQRLMSSFLASMVGENPTNGQH